MEVLSILYIFISYIRLSCGFFPHSSKFSLCLTCLKEGVFLIKKAFVKYKTQLQFRLFLKGNIFI